MVDEPITIGNWSPQQLRAGKYLGPITLETALAQSINTVAARLANEVGTNNVAATAHRLGITSQIQTDPSMALGAVEVTPLEMAEAYDAFANGGYRVHAYGIERIRTAAGQVLYDHGVGGADAAAGDRPAGAVGDGRDDAPGGGLRHRRRAPRSPATTSPARPAPPATTATPGSSASPAASSPRSGSGATTTRR